MNGEDYAEVIFFAYGVVVFFGLTEQQERGILEDVERAGAMRKKFGEDDWEVEECHYAVSVFFVRTSPSPASSRPDCCCSCGG